MTDKKELIKQILDRNKRGKNYRQSNWEPLWDAAGQFVQAQTGSMLSGGSRIEGEKRGLKVYDGTPESAKDIMVAGLYAGSCPDNFKWFSWRPIWLKGIPVPPELAKAPEMKRWISQCEDLAYQVINGSNYGDVTFSCFEWQASFGTGIKYHEQNDDKLINSQLVDLTECVFWENRFGIVDTLFREYTLSAREAIKRFGKTKVPDVILKADESGNKDDLFNFLHAVYPREDYEPSKRDRLNMPYASLHIYPDKQLLFEEGGYRTFPYTVSRMYKQGKERYGRGPAIKAMSDMGVLNEMAATNLVAGQRMVEPSLQAPDDGYTKAVDMSPGAINYYTPGKGEIKPIVTGINVPFGLELQDRQQKAVQRWFHVEVFLAITMADNQMTATEALERKQEKLQLTGPMLGRQKREHLDSDLDRIFSILLEEGYLLPPPDSFARYLDKLDTECAGPLFQAQRKRDSDSIISVVQKAALVATAMGDPSVLDNIDADKAYEIIADRESMPVEVSRDPKAVEQIRAMRQQQQQMMQQAQAGMAAVEAAKSLGQTPMDPGSPNAMTELMGMQPQGRA